MHHKGPVAGQKKESVSREGTSQEKRKRLKGHPLSVARGLQKAEPSPVGRPKEGEGRALEHKLGLK